MGVSMKDNRADGPRVVVIGSGIGGSAATLLLAHAGIPVTLVEKNRRLGGSCSGYEKQGFRIDMGTHMFCRGAKGPLGEVLRRASQAVCEGRDAGDLTTMDDPAALEQVRQRMTS